MRERIQRYQSAAPDDRTDFPVGNRILTQPFFFGEADWIPVPSSWSKNIVSFKTYNTDEPDGLHLWEAVTDRMARLQPDMIRDEERYGTPQLVRPRLGQGAFRVLVTDLYERRCAVTRERTLPALEAAHIRPYSDGGVHEASNGLLLRRDLHSLFDAGYVTVTPRIPFRGQPAHPGGVREWAAVLRAARSGDLCSGEVPGEAGLGLIEVAQRAVLPRLMTDADGCRRPRHPDAARRVRACAKAV
jgi:hypothetical protein